MQRQVNPDVCIVCAEHVKGVAKIKNFLVAVPAPMSVRIGEMAFTGAVGNAVFHTFTDLMPIRGSMGMDTGAVTGEGNAVGREQAVPEGREDGGKAEKLLETLFIMEREALMGEGISSQLLCNAGVFIGKLLSFTGFFGRLGVLILWEKILPAGFLQGFRLRPEPIHEAEIRPEGRKGIRTASNKECQEGVGLKPPAPGGKAGDAEEHHKDKGA